MIESSVSGLNVLPQRWRHHSAMVDAARDERRLNAFFMIPAASSMQNNQRSCNVSLQNQVCDSVAILQR